MFNIGTILNPDTTDIPLEAASYSLNLDSVTEDGKLKGVPEDVQATLLSDGHPVTPAAGAISYLMVNNQERLVIYDGSNWILCNSI